MQSPRTALAWSFAERYASLMMTIASTMILARLLTPTQVGIFSLCASVIAIAGMLRDFGVSEYLIQEKALTPEKMRAAFGVAIVTAWLLAAALFLSRHAIAAYYNETGVASVVGVLSLNFVILPLASPAFALFNREMAFRKIFVVQTASNAVQSCVGVGLALAGHGYMSLAWSSVSGILTQALIVTYLRPSDSLILPSLRSASGVVKYGSMLVVSRVIESVTRNFHEFVIAKQFGFGAVGLFSRAFGLVEMFNQNVTGAILRVATPAFAADHRADVTLNALFARGTAIMTSIAWPVLGFFALMSPEIIRLLFGSQWGEAAPIASVLAISLMPVYLVILANNVLTATGNVKRRMQVVMVHAPVHMTGVLIAASIGFLAVAEIWAVTNLFYAYLYIRQLKQVLNSSAAELFRPCLSSLVVAGASVLAQGVALLVARQVALGPLASVVLVFIPGACAWAVAARISNHPAVDEMTRLWRHFRPATL